MAVIPACDGGALDQWAAEGVPTATYKCTGAKQGHIPRNPALALGNWNIDRGRDLILVVGPLALDAMLWQSAPVMTEV